MLTPESQGVENKAMRPVPTNYGPGTYACSACRQITHFMGNSPTPILCPNCKQPMTMSVKSYG